MVESIETLFPDLSEVPRWGNRADFYSLFQALGSQLTTHEIKNTKKFFAKALTDFADSVDASLEDATVGAPSVKRYARAIEKGSNDKARRTDRHEVLIKIIEPFLREK